MSKPLTCFIIMPFDENFLPVRDMIRKVVRATKRGSAIRADDIFRPGNVVDQVKEAIEQSDFCIADVTGNNPNVMWEVGYASALRKPIIALRQHTEQLPFDVRQERFFTYDLQKPANVRRALTKAVNSVVTDVSSKSQFLGWHYDELTDLKQKLKRCYPRKGGKNLLTVLSDAVIKSSNTLWQVGDEERLMKALTPTGGKQARTDCFWWMIVHGVLVYSQINYFQVKGSESYRDNLRLVGFSDRGVALLNLLAREAGVRGQPTPGGGRRSKMTEEEFFDKLEGVSLKEAQVARTILDWSSEHFNSGVRWQRTSFVPVYKYKSKPSHNPITVFGAEKGRKVQIKFGRMKRHNGFSDETLTELLDRLNKIPGVNLQKSAVDKYPTVPLSALVAEKALNQFLSTIEWTIGRANESHTD